METPTIPPSPVAPALPPSAPIASSPFAFLVGVDDLSANQVARTMLLAYDIVTDREPASPRERALASVALYMQGRRDVLAARSAAPEGARHG